LQAASQERREERNQQQYSADREDEPLLHPKITGTSLRERSAAAKVQGGRGPRRPLEPKASVHQRSPRLGTARAAQYASLRRNLLVMKTLHKNDETDDENRYETNAG